MKMLRQGDVLVQRIPNHGRITGKPVPRENGAVVLAHGEVTGHSHSIAEEDVTLFDDGILVVEADGAVLRHQEHSEIALPKGRYRVIRQREYRPRELPAQVRD